MKPLSFLDATIRIATLSFPLVLACAAAQAAVPLYGVHELAFEGPSQGPTDAPARDVELVTRWRHEGSGLVHTIHGFWDGDGNGGPAGNVFKVRLCPTAPGKWTLVETTSNRPELAGQKQGYTVTCVASDHPGFWIVDREQTAGRWYQRSDGSHPYIYGNTMYSFLSEYDDKGPSGGNIANDIQGNAGYFKKVRFSIMGDRYPHPEVKPFLDDAGKPTDNGNFSHRPNPAWFRNRADLAVRTAYEYDLIADLILCGPDTEDSRSTLLAGQQRRRSDSPASVHRRPVRQLPERLDLPVQRVRHQAAEICVGADRPLRPDDATVPAVPDADEHPRASPATGTLN